MVNDIDTSSHAPSSVLTKAAYRAMGGGISGAGAMVCQVSSLMWLRTIMNYQYRHGTRFVDTAHMLYNEGGVRRFYRGVGPALLQGPLSRFGDTAANAGVITLLDSYDNTANLPVAFKTVVASGTAALWRINLMPLDNLKTSLQVNGRDGIEILKTKVGKGGFKTLYHGSLAAFGATFVGHYPWFFTYNYLNSIIPNYDNVWSNLCRNSGIGFSASVVSDMCSNSIRVLKTYKQSSSEVVSYKDAARGIIERDGLVGLFGRGLSTRILSNGIQGMLFTVLWKYFQGQLTKN